MGICICGWQLENCKKKHVAKEIAGKLKLFGYMNIMNEGNN